jgi:AcrR family transcriptional regulator
MARARDPEKRSAILEAAVQEIAETGLGATTAKIAERAGIATGTLFTYFASKEELLNELYIELKDEIFALLSERFPHSASLETRARHVWQTYLGWWMKTPERRRVSVLLNLSNILTHETRVRTMNASGPLKKMLVDLGARGLKEMPAGYAAATMSAMQEATMEFAAKDPKRRDELIEKGFRVFWRAVR